MTRSDGERKAWRGMIHETAGQWTEGSEWISTKVHRMARGSGYVCLSACLEEEVRTLKKSAGTVQDARQQQSCVVVEVGEAVMYF